MSIRSLLRSEKLKKIMKTHKARRLMLFGSFAHGCPGKHSDVDLLVDFKPQADLLDQVGLKIDIEELLGRKVDIATPNSLNKHIRSKVLKDAVRI